MSTEQIITLIVAVLGLITAILKHLEALKKGKGLEAVTDAIEEFDGKDLEDVLDPDNAALLIKTLKKKIEEKATANGGESTLNKEVRKAEMRKIRQG